MNAMTNLISVCCLQCYLVLDFAVVAFAAVVAAVNNVNSKMIYLLA
jgi:hypothetical protein